MNEPKGDLPPISCHPQKKQGLYLVFPSVHQLTTLLCWKPSNGFPLHLEKKIQTPSHDWQGAPCSGPCSFSSLIFHISFPLPCFCLCHIFTCWLHPISQVSVHMPAAQSSEGPSASILCGNLPVVIFVLLWFHCPSLFHLYVSKMIVYLLADCLIGI